MTVGELRKALESYCEEADVVVGAKDPSMFAVKFDIVEVREDEPMVIRLIPRSES